MWDDTDCHVSNRGTICATDIERARFLRRKTGQMRLSDAWLG